MARFGQMYFEHEQCGKTEPLTMYTPEPWKFEQGHILAQDDTVIAEVHDDDTFKRSDKDPEDVEAEYEAHGYLLAAAPDLLIAGEEILRALNSYGDWKNTEATKQLRMAIAKARGPQNNLA